jgi:hypothetical protein
VEEEEAESRRCGGVELLLKADRLNHEERGSRNTCDKEDPRKKGVTGGVRGCRVTQQRDPPVIGLTSNGGISRISSLLFLAKNKQFPASSPVCVKMSNSSGKIFSIGFLKLVVVRYEN